MEDTATSSGICIVKQTANRFCFSSRPPSPDAPASLSTSGYGPFLGLFSPSLLVPSRSFISPSLSLSRALCSFSISLAHRDVGGRIFRVITLDVHCRLFKHTLYVGCRFELNVRNDTSSGCIIWLFTTEYNSTTQKILMTHDASVGGFTVNGLLAPNVPPSTLTRKDCSPGSGCEHLC